MEEFYILSDGKLTRHENTIYFENEKGKTHIPLEKNMTFMPMDKYL